MSFKTQFIRVFVLLLITMVATACSQEKKNEPEEISAIMFKNPGCECCDKWASYLEQNGFSVSVEEPQNMPAVKRSNGVPYTMGSCHTALVGDYVVEGHVPQEDIRKLLDEQPNAKGIAVPQMPIGTPGMEIPGRPAEAYDVYLFGGEEGTTVFSSYPAEQAEG